MTAQFNLSGEGVRQHALSGGVANGFDVVAVGVTHEGAVIAWVVLGPDAWFMEHFGVSADRCLEECPHRSPVGCHERDMRLAEPLAAGPRSDPELWPGRHTETNDLPEVHHAASAERGEHSVVERGARGHVSALD